MGEKILLIDGHNIIHRAFYGVSTLTNAQGLHTNAIFGFLNTMFKVLEEEKPDYVCVAFDVSAPTFRHELYADYKGTRKPMPEELREQVPVLKKLLGAMGIATMEQAGLEADDLMGTAAKRSEARGLQVVVLSGDRDLLQLASDHILIRMPKTKSGGAEIEDYDGSGVRERYQVTPEQIIELKALMGDASDNIPGVPSIGEKTATNLIVKYGTIENAYAHLEEIKPTRAREALRQHYDMAKLSKTLATINTDCGYAFSWEAARLGDIYTREAYDLLKELEFKNMLKRFHLEAAAPKQEEPFREIADFTQAEAIFAKAEAEECVAFSLLFEEQRLLGVSFCLEEEACYIPVQGLMTEGYLAGRLVKSLSQVPRLVTLDLKEQLEALGTWVPEEELGLFLKRDGIWQDTGIGAYLLNPLKSQYTSQDLGREFLGLEVPSRMELFGKEKLSRMAQEKPGELLRFACYESYVQKKVMPVLEERLRDGGMWQLYTEVEMPLAMTLYYMEQAGIRVEAEALKVYGEQLSVRIAQLEEAIYQQAGEKFNINSPKQLGVILFEKLGMQGGKKTKTGYSTSAEVLEKLAPESPLVTDILEYRQLAKLKSTYADGLAVYIQEDGRIHSKFQQTVTATGRLSSTEPNLQNIPIRVELGRLIRKVFIPAEGYVLLDADYSQIELRVLAHMSGDEALIAAYREAQDIHRMTASQVFHVPFDQVTDLQRRNAKAVNFGIVYGISSFGLSQDLSITKKEAQEYIERYFETYPKIKEFLDGLVKGGREKGYVETLFGRRRPMPELTSSNFMQRSFGERVAMNAPIQGTAADIIKIAMNRVSQRLREEGLRSRLILQVHDELLVEAHKEELSRVQEILAGEMSQAAQMAVPLEIDMHGGSNWYEAH